MSNMYKVNWLLKWTSIYPSSSFNNDQHYAILVSSILPPTCNPMIISIVIISLLIIIMSLEVKLSILKCINISNTILTNGYNPVSCI